MRNYMKAMSKIALAVALSFSSGFSVFAEEEHREGKTDWQVTFNENKEMVSNFKTGEIDDVIYSMEPGDDVKFTLSLTNDYNHDTDWYMENEVLKSLENSQAVADGGAYTYRLEYSGPNGSKTLYDSEKVGGADSKIDTGIISGAGEEGLHQATSSLKDFFYLDTLKYQQSGKIDLYVMLEGESLINAYQDTLAQLQMNFAVELPKTNTPPVKEVHTGSYTHSMMWSLLLLLSGLCCIYLLILSKGSKKKRAKTLVVLLAGSLVFGTSKMDLHAEENLPSYSYTITFSSGNVGTFGGKDRIVVKANYGDVISFNAVARTSVNDPDKYYVRGFKKSGQDNNQRIVNASFKVTEDADYVVAYGAIGSMVAYTIQYVDEDGNELAPSETYYGNVGDKPVIACLYVDGYQPYAQNLTRTLSANEGSNLFRFVYRNLASNTTNPADNTNNNQQTTTPTTNGTNTTAPTTTDDGVVIRPGNAQDNNDAQADETEELVDIDEAETPLAEGDDTDTSNLHSTSKLPIVVGSIVGGVSILGIIFAILVGKKKKR